jgi:hypothetical protein
MERSELQRHVHADHATPAMRAPAPCCAMLAKIVNYPLPMHCISQDIAQPRL